MCDNCGISENSVLLLDVISNKGIIKMCKKCAEEKNLPIIKKFNLDALSEEEAEPHQTVYERLSKISGYEKRKNKLPDRIKKTPEIEKSPEQKEEEQKLKEIVEKNISKNLNEKDYRTDLIDHFHWIIMRERRKRKLTKEEFARALAEPEMIINLAEKGLISKENSRLVNKIENYLKIKIKKEENYSSEEENTPKEKEKEFTEKKGVMPLFKKLFSGNISFRSPEIEDLKIEDLRKAKENPRN